MNNELNDRSILSSHAYEFIKKLEGKEGKSSLLGNGIDKMSIRPCIFYGVLGQVTSRKFILTN